MNSSGSAKESGSVGESSGSSAMASGSSASSGESDSSSGSGGIYGGSSSSSDSSGSGSSRSCSCSSCDCDFVVSEIMLTSATSGSYKVANTGCGEVLFIRHEGQQDVPSGFPINEDETLHNYITGDVDLRLTRFTVVTDCRSEIHEWPDFP